MRILNLSGTAYAGPERRDTSPEGLERRRLHQERLEAEAVSGGGHRSIKDQIEAQLLRLPKPWLVAISAVAIAAGAQQAIAWKSGVDTHVARADAGYHRLATVEESVAVLRKGQEEMRAEFRAEIREFRRDTLEGERWRALQQSDDQRVRALDARIRSLERK